MKRLELVLFLSIFSTIAFRENKNETDVKKLQKMYEEGDMAYTHMKAYCDAVASPSGDWNVNWTVEDVKKRYDQIPWKTHTTYPDNLRW